MKAILKNFSKAYTMIFFKYSPAQTTIKKLSVDYTGIGISIW